MHPESEPVAPDLAKLRVLIVIDRVEDVGGAEGSTAILLRGAHRAGVSVSAVGLDGVDIPDRDELAAAGVEFFTAGGRGTLAAVRAVRAAIRATQPVLIHSTLARADMAARVAGAVAGVPVMTSLVNAQYGTQARRLSRSAARLAVYRYVDGLLARHYTFAFHAISEAAAEAAIRALGIRRADIRVVPRGRSDQTMGRRTVERGASIRAELGIPRDASVVVNIAREDLQKGQWLLVDALGEVNSARPEPVHLVIVGRPGTASAQIDAAVARGGYAQRRASPRRAPRHP